MKIRENNGSFELTLYICVFNVSSHNIHAPQLPSLCFVFCFIIPAETPGENKAKVKLNESFEERSQRSKLDLHNWKVFPLCFSFIFLLPVFSPTAKKDGRNFRGSSGTPFHIQLPLFAKHHTAFLQ